MKKYLIIITCLLSFSIYGQIRKEIIIPDILDYKTLKGDFHMHTPFSDGTVWPEDRVIEAWLEGLDVIAITDHIESEYNKSGINLSLNKVYEIAKPIADKHNIILIQAGEITRNMPPGHLNAYFLSDVNALRVDSYMEAIETAIKQGAFIIWNHPGWKAKLSDSTKWYDIHTELYNKGWLKGIEIVNEKEYYPEVFQWAIDKNLTIFGNSDIHTQISFEYDLLKGEHRPITLVFVKNETEHGIKEAFENQRTAVLYDNKLYGKEEYLKEIFNNSIELKQEFLFVDGRNNANIQVYNSSSIPIELVSKDTDKKIHVPAQSTVLINVVCDEFSGEATLLLPYYVVNYHTAPEKFLDIELAINAININKPVLKSLNDGIELHFEKLSKDKEIRFSTNKNDLKLNEENNSSTIKEKGSFDIYYQIYKDNSPFGNLYNLNVNIHEALNSKTKLVSPYKEKYSAGGENAVCDGLLGTEDFMCGYWQGYEGNDFEIIIELKESKPIEVIEVNFLHNINSWIFAPERVEVFYSDNGKDFELIDTTELEKPSDNDNKEIKTLKFDNNIPETKYLKLKAKNIGKCPDWHSGNGNDAWLFIDEVIVK